MDEVKYDRQIRLFGLETQQKLCSMKVQIFGAANLVSAEIIKNLVLLGVGRIVVSEEMLREVKRIVPDELEWINPNLGVEILDRCIKSDFMFCVDEESVGSKVTSGASTDASAARDSADSSAASGAGPSAARQADPSVASDSASSSAASMRDSAGDSVSAGASHSAARQADSARDSAGASISTSASTADSAASTADNARDSSTASLKPTTPSNTTSVYFICSKCLLISRMNTHKCSGGTDQLIEAKQCLTGALAVQEFIKTVQGKASEEEVRVPI